MKLNLSTIAAAALLAGAQLPASAQGSGIDTAVGAPPQAPMTRAEQRNNSGATATDGRDQRQKERNLQRAEAEKRQERYGRNDRYDRYDRYDRPERYYENARDPVFRRGGYVPPLYRDQQYWVNDWSRHNLRRPPSGHRWVQVGGDYVLVAIATGLIVELLLNQ